MSRPIACVRRAGLAARKKRVNSGAYVPETDQTAQTDRSIENQRKFALLPGQKLTTPHPELTSEPDHGRVKALVA
jgi:hypothetical protein